MKTVIDAVKELKGELNGAAGVCYPEDSYLFYALDGSHYIFDECKDTDGVYQYVCTRKEFLATVAECETNFGKCNISFSEHCTNETIRITKPPIFTQEMADNGVWPSVGMECLINFPDIDNAWYKYTIDFMGKHTFIASCEDVSERFGHVDDVYFKPLTPPKTDDEKFMDALVEYNLCTDDLDWKEHLLGFIKSGELHGVSFQPLTVGVK